jgi:hypothetical protein
VLFLQIQKNFWKYRDYVKGVMMSEAPNLDCEATKIAIATRLYLKLQIAKMQISILRYQLLDNMQKKIKPMQLLQYLKQEKPSNS